MRAKSPILSAVLALQAATSALGTVHHHYNNGNPRYVSSFKWERPFPYDNTAPLNTDTKCEVEKTFKAEQWKLKDLQAPSPWAPAIETFIGWHPYPGTWEGIDPDAEEREYLIMDYTDVPVPVREWIDKQHHDKDDVNSKWWLFGVFEKPLEQGKKIASLAVGEQRPAAKDEDKVVLFAPAAMYDILPIWVGKGSECEADMLDLSKYTSSYAKDQSVIAWPIEHQIPDTKHGKKDISFNIKAFYVVETDHGKAWREMWEKLHVSVRRQERKLQREERKKQKAAIGKVDLETGANTHVRDEL